MGEMPESTMWIAYKEEAKELFKIMEVEKGSALPTIPAKHGSKIEFMRKIEVAVLEGIKIIGRPFIGSNPVPDNWDYLVYQDIIGSTTKSYSVVHVSFFYNWKLWAPAVKEEAVHNALKRLKLVR